MERREHNQYSPAGEIDRWGDLAHGLRHNRPGRRRAGRMLVGLALVVLVATGLVYLLVVSGLIA